MNDVVSVKGWDGASGYLVVLALFAVQRGFNICNSAPVRNFHLLPGIALVVPVICLLENTGQEFELTNATGLWLIAAVAEGQLERILGVTALQCKRNAKGLAQCSCQLPLF
jgi:hypothetical protein